MRSCSSRSTDTATQDLPEEVATTSPTMSLARCLPRCAARASYLVVQVLPPTRLLAPSTWIQVGKCLTFGLLQLHIFNS